MKQRLKWSLLYCAYYAAMQATLTRLLARLRVSSLLRCVYYCQRDDLTTRARRTIIIILSSLQFHAFLVVTSICLKWCVTINEIIVLSMHLQGEAGFHHFFYHRHWPPSPSSLPSMCVCVVRVCSLLHAWWWSYIPCLFWRSKSLPLLLLQLSLLRLRVLMLQLFVSLQCFIVDERNSIAVEDRRWMFNPLPVSTSSFCYLCCVIQCNSALSWRSRKNNVLWKGIVL